MRIVSLLPVVLLCYLAVAQQCADIKVDDNSMTCLNDEDYIEIFFDDFNGSALDQSKWRKGQSYGPDNYKAETQLYMAGIWDSHLASLYDVSGGTITLSIDEITPFQYNNDTYKFASAYLNSHQRFGYGKYEVRCKTPIGVGLWPAAWLYSGDRCFDEIDIFEFFAINSKECVPNRWDYPNQTAYDAARLAYENRIFNRPKFNSHYNEEFSTCTSDNSHLNQFECIDSVLFSNNFHSSFQTYTMIYTPYKIEFIINGVNYRTIYRYRSVSSGQGLECHQLGAASKRNKSKYFPVDAFMSMIFATKLNSHTSNDIDLETIDELPLSMEIDYFRHSVKGSCSDQIITSDADLGPTLSRDFYAKPLYHYKIGNTITINGNVEIPDFAFYEFIADKSIVFKSGFKASSLRSVDYPQLYDFPGADPNTRVIARLDDNVCVSSNKFIPVNQSNYPYTDPMLPNVDSSINLTADPILENINEHYLNTYPNPINNQLVIINDSNYEVYCIMDLTGRVIKNGVLNPNKNSLNMDGIMAGPYYLELKSDKGSEIIKIVKQ